MAKCRLSRYSLQQWVPTTFATRIDGRLKWRDDHPAGVEKNLLTTKSFIAALATVSIVPLTALSVTREMTDARIEDPAVEGIAVDYYARMFQVSPQEASRRVGVQGRAAGIEEELQSAIGDHGGIWFDPKNGGHLKIGLIDPSQRQIVEKIIEDRGLAHDAELILVRHSERELRRIKDDVRSTLDDLLSDGLVKVSYSTATNRIIVNARSDLPDEVRQRLETLPGNPEVDLQGLEERLVELQSYGVECGILTADEGCQTLRGGIPLLAAGPTFGRCTAGFIAVSEHESLGGPLVIDSYWILTAGHCVGDAGFIWSAPTKVGQLQQINPFGGIKFFEGGSSGSDVAAIRIEPGSFWTNQNPAAGPWIVALPTLPKLQYYERYPIYGTSTAAMGQLVCSTGVTSDTHCGVVTALGVSEHVNVNGGSESLNGLTETDICDGPGDSGAPVFMSNTAYGTIVGGKNSASTCLTVYQDIAISENLLGLRVFLGLRPFGL